MGKFLRGVRRWVGGWSAGHDQGVEAYIHGRLDEAERRFSSLVRQAASSWPMAPRVVIVRNNLAATWEAQGRSGDAERMYQDLVELWPRLALLADQPEPVVVEFAAARLLAARGAHDPAEAIVRRVLQEASDASRFFPPATADVVEALDVLADIHVGRGEAERACLTARWALGLRETVFGPDHPALLGALRRVAHLLGVLGESAAGDCHEARARRIEGAALGEGAAGTVTGAPPAGIWDSRGRWIPAGAVCERAVAMRARRLRRSSGDLAERLDQLAASHQFYADRWLNVSKDWRRREHEHEVQRLYERAFRIRRIHLGPRHPDVGTSLDHRAAVEPRTYAIRFTVPPVSDASGISAMPRRLYQQALAIREAALGPEDPAVAVSLHNLASLCGDDERVAAAEGGRSEPARCPLYRRALAIREAALGPDHPAVAETLLCLAREYIADGGKAEADALVRRALSIQEAALGIDDVRVARTLHTLAQLAHDRGRFAEGEELRGRLRSLQQQVFGEVFPLA